jgi:hypothetical protein
VEDADVGRRRAQADEAALSVVGLSVGVEPRVDGEALEAHDEPGALTALDALAELLTTPALTQRVAHFGGYDLTSCETRIST